MIFWQNKIVLDRYSSKQMTLEKNERDGGTILLLHRALIAVQTEQNVEDDCWNQRQVLLVLRIPIGE